jgi:hypothetical protein
MTRNQLIQEVFALYQEKELICSTEDIQLLLGVIQHLTRRGVPVSREILDFTIDVIRVKSLVGLSPELTEEDLDRAKTEMVEWLEAMGWRRTWFNRPLHQAG